jgi:predicted site-specific integrase-resolvase
VTGPIGTRAAADRAGVTYRQVDHWCRTGYVKAPADGSGTVRAIPAGEVEVLLMMARMVNAGLHSSRAAYLARRSVTENLRTLPLGGGLVLLVGPR